MSARTVLATAVATAGLTYSAAAGLLTPLLPAEVAGVASVVTVQKAAPSAPQAPAVATSSPAPAVLLCTPQSSAQGAPQAVAGAPAGPAGTGTLDANTATAAQFDALPLRAITPEVAAAIVARRAELGGRFTSVAQLFEVSGVGPATERQLPGLVHV